MAYTSVTPQGGGRMLKMTASFVLASFRPSTYPRGYASGSSLAAAALDSHFEHPAEKGSRPTVLSCEASLTRVQKFMTMLENLV